MAIVVIYLDPNTAPDTGDDIIDKINLANNSISRTDAVDADSLDLVKTIPISGDMKVKSISIGADGKIAVSYDDVPV